MPTQTPRNGTPRPITRSSSASTSPGIAWSPSAQALNEPTPGSTTRRAPRTSAGSAVTATRSAPAAISALWTEWRLPAP